MTDDSDNVEVGDCQLKSTDMDQGMNTSDNSHPPPVTTRVEDVSNGNIERYENWRPGSVPGLLWTASTCL